MSENAFLHGLRLGRVEEHDERSRDYQAHAVTPTTVMWQHNGPVLNQGNLGSCTGNAISQALNCAPLFEARGLRTGDTRLLTEDDAVNIYGKATHLDKIQGVYPPEDTGSSGLAVAKAAKHMGLITQYRHAFGITHTLSALSWGPVIIGVPWTNDMFTPNAEGFIKPTGAVAGGHEFVLIGSATAAGFVTMLNSWGDTWGDEGCAKIAYEDLDYLLEQGGDVTQLIA